VRFCGEDLLDRNDDALQTIRGRRIGMVFQEPQTSLNPVFTVGEQIAEPLRIHLSLPEPVIRERSLKLLDAVGIDLPEQRLAAYPHQLSGGQRQRVMIAMALACDPELMIADEPTTALDVTVQAQILRLINRLQREHAMSVLYITHDLGVVSQIADRVYVMYAGIIVETGPVERLFRNPRHPYTRALLDSLPNRKKRGLRLYSIPGSVPHPACKPAGCPFHPRCPKAIADCRSLFPGMCAFDDGHDARCPVVAGRKDWCRSLTLNPVQSNAWISCESKS
jgi:oligopeptide/dipeptide ABC transporter ATP-binding protein